MNTQPSCTVHIVGGESFFRALNKTKSLKGEAGSLLLAIDSHHCLTIPITPGRNILNCLSKLMSRFQFSKNLEFYKDLL